MFTRITKSIFGDPMARAVEKYREVVEKINSFEPTLQKLDDDELIKSTTEFRERLVQGETLTDLLPEAFAVVREASVRTIGMRHYDVQLIGGVVLHEGRIAEMKTGEGKTLVATLPIYLNALTGKGVHLVTPNDYLSKHGLQLMGPIYHFLGLSAAVIQNTGGNPNTGSYMYDPDFNSDDARYQNLRPVTRREAYAADITYGTNNEFGFDYLRDNMVWENEQLTQRELNFAIVDEVDNILIDEARTPLIISGQADQPSDYYKKFASIVKQLNASSQDSVDEEEPDGDFVIDIKDRISYLTEAGVEKVERILGIEQLYHPTNAEMIPYLDNSLRANALYQRDHEYVVQGGQVVIVDDFTGRLMPGRRFSEGLHQAIEAKEGVEIRRENMTMATITFQNFFRMYDKLAGMTGTALTEQEEFEKIYDLDVIVIPTNVPVVREDQQDLIYMTETAKWNAVVDEIKQRQEHDQPILVGTVAIETSERLSKLLRKRNIKHNVLNAKQHEREAEIITQAGQPGMVTIATNMAGRGVDILLGGNPEGIARELLRKRGVEITEASEEEWEAALAEARKTTDADRDRVMTSGGLYVIGTERHDARRIDNQLRGRSGRQGDPGESRFFLSLEDDLIQRFSGDRVKSFMSWANLPEGEPIEHSMISKSIEQAQVRVEGHNFDIRKRVLEYDDVVNRQREIIYTNRLDWLSKKTDELRTDYLAVIEEELLGVIDEYVFDEAGQDRDDDAMHKALFSVFPVPEEITAESLAALDIDALEDNIVTAARGTFEQKAEQLDEVQPGLMDRALRLTMLRSIDQHWQRHLTDLDVLREGIGLRSVAQQDPLVEYQREGFRMFQTMQAEINQVAARNIFMVQPAVAQKSTRRRQINATRRGTTNAPKKPQPVQKAKSLGRNEKCWCGSGKKYKHCHMREDKAKATSPA